MSERSPPRDETPILDPPPASDKPASDKPTPVQRIQKLRLRVRAVWWSAVALTVVFAGVALWMGVARGDPFALFFAALAASCALVGYGTLLAVRRPSAS